MTGRIHHEKRGHQAAVVWGVFLAALSLLLGGCVMSSPSEDIFAVRRTTLPQSRVEVPAEFFSRRVMVTATINGVGPFRLLLDTGARGLILSRAAAERAKLDLVPLVWIRGSVLGGSGVQKQRLARVPQLRAGGLELEGLSACVVAPGDWKQFDDALHAVAVVGPCDGILGMGPFRDLILEIDYPAKGVVVHRPDSEAFPDALGIRCVFRHGIPYVELQLPERTLPVLVDTGDNGDLTLPTLENLPLLHGRQRFDGLAFGLGGSAKRGESGQLDGAAQLGPITWHHLPVDTGRGPPRLGSRALSPWRVVLDRNRERLYLIGSNQEVKVAEVPVQKLEDKMGFFGKIEGDTVRLLEVDRGGVFDWVGLRTGDVILEIDGMTAVQWFKRQAGGLPHPAETVLWGRREGRRFSAKLVWEQK